MKYSQARQGRVFVIRLEDGEVVHETLENFARQQGINGAAVILVGGAAGGSKLVVGPLLEGARPIDPMTHVLEDVHEITGSGTLFPDEGGNPVLHLHMACGRGDRAKTGCVRQGVRVWQIMEVILFEVVEVNCKRIRDPDLGFLLLHPDGG
jgi:predicted DNA-binding protein with PD1-like motif